MIDSILLERNVSVKAKIGIKATIATCLIALAIGLPQIVHLAFGASGGITFLPMYLPILLAGLVLGWKFGLVVGVLSPICSFLLTSISGNAMPALARLPFMIVELAVFAGVSGIFSKKIMSNKWIAFPAVLIASVCGRLVFIALAAIFESVTPFSLSLILSQVKTGLVGLVCQAVIVPLIVIFLSKLIKREEASE